MLLYQSVSKTTLSPITGIYSLFLLYPMRSMGESIGIGLAASSTSKGPQAKTTEPMDSIKFLNLSQHGLQIASDI